MEKKAKEKRNDITKVIKDVSLEVSQWPEWLRKNAETVLASDFSLTDSDLPKKKKDMGEPLAEL